MARIAAPSCKLISGELEQVKNYLSAQFDCPQQKLKPFMDYLKNYQGKMLRASFVLLGGRLFSRITDLHIKIAAVVEMIHMATLLHDDVIDSASFRRNRRTVNSIWGTNLAVLLGDFLLTKVLANLSSLGREDINHILADMAGKICQGEMLQNVSRNNPVITVEEYLNIIENKTAVFFADCCKLGAVASGNSDERIITSLYRFGLNFGMAFQIIDDLVDIMGMESRSGKTAARDLLSGTFTLPVIYAINTLSPEDREHFVSLLEASQPDLKKIKSILLSSNGIDYAKSFAMQYQQKALDEIECFGDNAAAGELRNLVLYTSEALS